MTEDQARTKLCIQTLGATAIAGEANFYHANCFASDCMAWRELETAEFKNRADHVFKISGARIRPDEGFCGLAGKP